MREERGSPEKGGTERGGGRGVPSGGDTASPDAPSFAAAAGPSRVKIEKALCCPVWSVNSATYLARELSSILISCHFILSF
jgi:hypothetical protein